MRTRVERALTRTYHRLRFRRLHLPEFYWVSKDPPGINPTSREW